MKLVYVLASFWMVSLAASAWANNGCQEGEQSIAGGCAWISHEHNISVPGMSDGGKSRSFTFSTDGQFMVFDSFSSSGSNSASTGSRTFYFFPIERKPSLDKNVAGQVVVHTASAAAVVFNPNGRIASIAGASFSESPSISGTNQGGVEVKYTRGILLDSGWMRGNSAIFQKSRFSVFKDPRGESCSVRNSSIFTYPSKYVANPIFKSTKSLSSFLAKNCPGLDLSTLEHATPGGGAGRRSDAGALR